ncbi:hypothetical protein TB2_014715 [Malus domestica]
MPGMSDGDHAKTSRFSLRKAVSSSFSARFRREPILAFFSGCWGSRMMSPTSSSDFHPISSAWAPSSRSVCCNCYLVASSSLWISVASTGVKVLFFYSFNTCTVHRRDAAWSDLISPTPLPRDAESNFLLLDGSDGIQLDQPRSPKNPIVER